MQNSSRRLVLRAPSPGFAVAGAPHEVFLSCTILPQAVECRPPSLGSSSASRLHADDPGGSSPLEVRISRPSAVQRCCVHSPASEDAVRRAGTTQPVMFRPHGFSPSRRVAPLLRLQVCFALLRPWGSRRFRLPLAPTAEATGPSSPFQSCSNPSKFVLASSRAVSPRPFPP